MTRPEDEIDQALVRMAEGAPPEPVLQLYGEALRRLEALRPAPERDPQAMLDGRQAFLDQAASATVSHAALSRHKVRTLDGRKERRPMSAWIGLLMALALLIGGGGTTALAAQDALPNDALYGIKLATEDLQFGLTNDPARQISLLESWADRRVLEMERLTLSGEVVPSQTANRLQTQLAGALRVAAQLQDPDLTAAMLRLQVRLETCLRTMERLRIADPNGAALQAAEQAMIQIRAEIRGALEDPSAFRVRYGAGRPADAPVQPNVVPGEPPLTPPGGNGNDAGTSDGQGPNPDARQGPNPEAGDGAGLQGGYGPGDGTCQCTPQSDGGPSPTCTPHLWETPGPHGGGSGSGGK